MKSRNRSAEDEGSAIDLTPMLDVVFIMLIFFIVTATFIKEPGVEVDRPDATSATLKNAKILIAIDPEDQVWIDKKQVDEGQISDQIELLISENPKSPVVIQADSESSIKALDQVLQATRQLGIIDISIAAQKD